jgi:hypothetical protein
MQIDLNQDEIEAAIVSYITSQGIDLTNKGTAVTMVAGRGERGFTATVEILKEKPGSAAPVPPAPPAPPAAYDDAPEAVESDEPDSPGDADPLFG